VWGRGVDSVSSLNQMSCALLMSAAYYLLLQDRIEEGRDMFARIDVTKMKNEAKAMGLVDEAQLQYDYITAYLDFYNPEGGAVATGNITPLSHCVIHSSTDDRCE
jgi:hypothetical protein